MALQVVVGTSSGLEQMAGTDSKISKNKSLQMFSFIRNKSMTNQLLP